ALGTCAAGAGAGSGPLPRHHRTHCSMKENHIMRTNHRSAILLALFLAGHPVQAEDISSFWRDTLERLATEPIDAREADVREPLPYKSMRVEYRSLGRNLSMILRHPPKLFSV